MDMKTYMEEASRTLDDSNEMDRSFIETDKQLLGELTALDLHASAADAIKRNLFYSDDVLKRGEMQRVRIQEVFEKIKASPENIKMGDHKDLIHAALGIMGEAGEIFEEIVAATLEDRPINLKNMREEGGDIMWYLHVFFKAIGSDFEEAGQVNIDKLYKRYPNKFEKSLAINRDLDEEKKVIEA